MKLSRRPADKDHPFGYGKDVYFWTFVVAIMFFTLGGAFSIWEAVRHVLHPIEKTATGWACGVLAVALADYWRDNRDPTLLTALLEDGAVLSSP